MTAIILGGDCATTTTLAVAAGWPRGVDVAREREVVVVEADPSGGSLAAWLDTPLSPSLSAVVTALHQGTAGGATRPTQWSTVDAMIRRSASGIRFIPAPFRSREARGAIGEAELTLFPLLCDTDDTVALVDVGRIDPWRLPAAAHGADLVVLVHRQDPSSAPAATVRVERLGETVAALQGAGHRVAVAVIGTDPFPLDEILDFTRPNGPAWVLEIDPLSAAVLAGRSGVSARRLARLPLMRSAAAVATDLARLVAPPPHLDRPTPERGLVAGGGTP